MSETATDFVRRILAMPEQVAIGYLETWHLDTCKCGRKGEGPRLLTHLRRQWADKL